MQKQRPHDLCQTVHFFKSGVIKNVLGTSLFVAQIFKAKKNLPRKVCDTGDRGITEYIPADMIAFMAKSGSMWFDTSTDNDRQHMYI